MKNLLDQFSKKKKTFKASFRKLSEIFCLKDWLRKKKPYSFNNDKKKEKYSNIKKNQARLSVFLFLTFTFEQF